MTDLGDFSASSEDDDSDPPEPSASETNATESESLDSETSTSEVNVGDFETGTSTDSSDEDRFDAMATDPVGTDRGIGTLSAVEGLRIGEQEDETCLRAYVTADNREDVRVGKYLLVPYPDGEKLFARICALEYMQEYRVDDATEIHAKRAMRRDDIEETDYKLMADLEPVAVLYRDGDGPDTELKRRMTDRVPKPKAVVREASDKSEIKTGLKMPEDGVFLGHLSVGGEKVKTAASPPTIDYRLKDDYDSGDPLVFRHTLVAGGTGSGKTHSSKNVLRQYLGRTYEMGDGRTPELAVVQFDPQDEYAQMHDDNPKMDDDFARRCEREGVKTGGHDDTIAFVPKVAGAEYSASHHHAEQVEFTVPFSLVHSNPWLIAGASLNDNQYTALTNTLLPRFKREYGRNATYDRFRTFLSDPALKAELDESGDIHEATFDAVKRRVQGFGAVFDQDARPITDQISQLVRAGGLTVIPTYHITDSRTASTIVLAVSSLLIDQKLSNDPLYDRIKETPLVLGMDEAHNFLTDADSVQGRQVIGKFTEAAKQGRKERLGLYLITQDPQDIVDPVFKQINTTMVLNLGDEDAIKAVNIPPNLEGKVPYMETGQMVVYSPDNSEPVELVGLSNCLTRHGD